MQEHPVEHDWVTNEHRLRVRTLSCDPFRRLAHRELGVGAVLAKRVAIETRCPDGVGVVFLRQRLELPVEAAVARIDGGEFAAVEGSGHGEPE